MLLFRWYAQIYLEWPSPKKLSIKFFLESVGMLIVSFG